MRLVAPQLDARVAEDPTTVTAGFLRWHVLRPSVVPGRSEGRRDRIGSCTSRCPPAPNGWQDPDMASLIDASNGKKSDAIAHGPVLLARPAGGSRQFTFPTPQEQGLTTALGYDTHDLSRF